MAFLNIEFIQGLANRRHANDSFYFFLKRGKLVGVKGRTLEGGGGENGREEIERETGIARGSSVSVFWFPWQPVTKSSGQTIICMIQDCSRIISVKFCQNICNGSVVNAIFNFSHNKSMENLSCHGNQRDNFHEKHKISAP